MPYPSRPDQAEMTATALAVASRHARRLARTLRLPAADMADVQQDLLVELYRRAPRFDGRIGWPAFAGMVVRHAAHDLADRLVRQHGHRGGSIDDGVLAGAVSRHEALAEETGLGAWWSGHADPVAACELRIDLGRFLAGLPDHLRRLCLLLTDDDPGPRSGLSRSQFFRQVHEIRMRLRAFGLRPTLRGQSGGCAGT